MKEFKTITIRFQDVSLDVASQKARALRMDLLDTSPGIKVDIKKDDPTNQDFGATLVVVLGTPAVLAIAKGIANYLSRDRAKITIEANGKVVVAEGISGDDAARIAEAISGHE
jgi:hypothetical protein